MNQATHLAKHPATKKYKLTSLRYAMVGAAPLSQELTQQFLKLFPHVKLGQGYGEELSLTRFDGLIGGSLGMTETSTTVIMVCSLLQLPCIGLTPAFMII